MKNYFTLLFMVSAFLITVGCQVKPTLMNTTDFNEDTSSAYIHTDYPIGEKKENPVHFYVDDREVVSLKEITKGIPIKPGKHSFTVADEQNHRQKLEYLSEKGKDYHLVYCEKDGSVHWYSKEHAKNGAHAIAGNPYCRPLTGAR